MKTRNDVMICTTIRRSINKLKVSVGVGVMDGVQANAGGVSKVVIGQGARRVVCGEASSMTLIAGPCVIESLDKCLEIGEAVLKASEALGIGYVFKASFDKANRTSGGSFRGPGLEGGLRVLEGVKDRLGVPVTTDVHESGQAEAVAQVCDLQPGEFIHTFGDAHIYNNHFEQLELQLSRDPKPLPKMMTNKATHMNILALLMLESNVEALMNNKN